ncbi:MAG: hypothetical protein OEQ39_03000 [Gammaproteobacteria bacterium]|nr:hypothetical protein [Gammaproteobacteria bacterium]
MKDCSTCRFSVEANPHLHGYPSLDPEFFAMLPCARCTASEPQYERRRVSYLGQWEKPDRGTWRMMEVKPAECEVPMAAVLRAYLLLGKEERRRLRLSGVGMYARVAVVFCPDEEDFLAAKMSAPVGVSNAEVGRRIGPRGISRQLAYKRARAIRRKLARWREVVYEDG